MINGRNKKYRRMWFYDVIGLAVMRNQHFADISHFYASDKLDGDAKYHIWNFKFSSSIFILDCFKHLGYPMWQS